MWDVDIVCDKLFWPPRMKAMFGISADVPVSMVDFYQGLHADDRESTTAAFAAAIVNPDRVIDPSTGIRKIDLIHFYESVADRILPHLKNRPVSLVRAPQGITGQLFFRSILKPRLKDSRSWTRRCGQAMTRCSRSTLSRA